MADLGLCGLKYAATGPLDGAGAGHSALPVFSAALEIQSKDH